ncbi:MAG: GTPase Era [Alphaproteobacteria bacterium]|nr:MAG: GTPase Era [Alphaproteobacteria bacterium]
MAKAAKTVRAAGADETGAERSTRCGFVALIGAPNAGKSTLLNALVGEKVAIVTPKVQTTRMRLKGIAMIGDSQIVFVDTPGIFAPRRRLDRAMVAAAWEGARDADEVVLVIDAERGIDARVGMILDGLKQEGRSVVVALNKIDRVKKPVLLELARRLDETGLARRIFMISAIRGEGVADLKAWLADNLPEGPWLYPPDQVTDIANRVMAAEITREKIYLRLHEELPYQIAVETEEWEERDDGSVVIRQVIHVMRETQKRIVIGRGGRMLKEIGRAARLEMEEIFARRVHLFLFVRVSERWQDERRHYLELGLDYVR